MRKARLAAMFTAVMMGMMSCSGTPAYAQDNTTAAITENENKDPMGTTETTEDKESDTVESITEFLGVMKTEEPAETDGTEEPAEAGEKETTDILSSVPLDTSVISRLAVGLDPEIVEVLLENPKLMALIMPTLHVTVTDNAVKIAFREEEPADPILMGTVRTNGGNLNVRAGAGIGSAVISQLKNGTEVKVIGEKDGWYEIEIPSDYAYVCGKYLELNRLTPEKTEEGYTFDVDGATIAGFLQLFEDFFTPEPVPADPEGMTPDGNLTLVDDYGPVTGVGQQFLTMVSKNGNYFYMVIDRNDKGEENVHFLNLVDERDLMDLMAKDDKGTYESITAAEKAAEEARAQAEKEAAEKAEAEAKEREKSESSGKKKLNLMPLLLVIPILAVAGAAWLRLQTKKKKKEAISPDPDAGYAEDEENDEEDYGAGEEDTEDTADTEDAENTDGTDDDPEADDDASEEEAASDDAGDSDDPEEL